MRLFKIITYLSVFFLVTACEPLDISKLTKSQFSSAKGQIKEAGKALSILPDVSDVSDAKPMPLSSLIKSAAADIEVDQGFKPAIKLAVLSDPLVMSANNDLSSQQASIEISKSLKDFQISGTVYGGIEDVSDETAGVAVVLSANRMIFDGGQLDNQISSQEFIAQAAAFKLEALKNERAYDAANAWLDLERYLSLSRLIGDRLEVLGPLIKQLETVAEAGVGDVSRVAAAQRTVSLIRVTQTDVAERLEQAKVNFIAIFGNLPSEAVYDGDALSKSVPSVIESDMILQASGLKAEYAAYQAALAGLKLVQAKDNYNVGFESKVQRPIGGSSLDSDESIGLVVQKTFYNGQKLASELSQSQAKLDAQAERLKSTFRLGKKAVENSQQTIKSMDNAIALAKINAENLSEEIKYLKQQLIIGQSTLDSVLSAEARLYDAQSKEINFMASRMLAELTLLSTFGLLTNFFEIE